MSEEKDKHQLSALADFLIGSKKNSRLLWRINIILLVVQLPIIIYLAVYISPAEYPDWWQAMVDWVYCNIPAAQGWTYRAIAYREQMPAIYMIWFIFSILAGVAAVLLTNKAHIRSLEDVKNLAVFKILMPIAVCFFFIMVVWFMYLWPRESPAIKPLRRMGALIEHAFGLYILAIMFFSNSAMFMANPLIMVRRKIGKAIQIRIANKES